MRKHNLGILQALKSKLGSKEENEGRPAKFVPDGFNSWRVVWADISTRK